MNEPTNEMPGRPRVAGIWQPVATLSILAAVCFARLFADPTALIVDGDRPSIDYANRGDPRPVGNDLTFLFLPHHWSIAERIARHGHWPAWDARGFGGRPFAGNPQAGMSYPPAWIAWRLRTPSVLGWLTIGHLVWGGIGTYVLVRSMNAGRWAATVAAGVYQASPFLLAHTFEGHYPHVWAACWYPWAFWAYRRRREGRARGLLLAPILALTCLTGHPQEWLLLVLTLSIWAAADGIRVWQSGSPRRGAARVVAWGGVLMLSIGMAGVDIVPQSFARTWVRRNHDPGLDGVPRRYHLGGLNAFQLLSPTALGAPADYFGDDNYWESVFSIGLVPLVLALVAVLRHPDRRLVRGWLVLLAVALVFACGRPLGLYSLCYAAIPGINQIRVPARSLFLANMAGAVLVGLGLETLRSRMTRPADWRRLSRSLVVVGLVVLGLLLVIHGPRSTGRIPPRIRTGVATLAPIAPPSSGRGAMAASRVLRDPRVGTSIGGMVLAIALGFRRIGRGGRRRLVDLVGWLGLVELGAYGFTLMQTTPADRFVARDPIGDALTSLSGDPARSGTRVRIKARDSFYGDLPAIVHGIEKTNVGDAFQLDRPATLYETLYPVASHVRPMTERLLSPAAKESWRRIRQAVLDRMGVEFLVSDRVETDPPWPVAAEGTWEGSTYVIQRNTSAMPRAYVVPRAMLLPDHPGVLVSSLAGLDPRESVIMTADPLARVAPGLRQAFKPVVWTSLDPDRPAWLVETKAPGLLVVAEAWMPGWSATVDGRPTPILVGNVAQRVVPLQYPGLHTVAMVYHPPGLVLGCCLSLASALTWMITSAQRMIRHIRTVAQPRSAIRGHHLIPLAVAAGRRKD